ncbi:MAG: hypothetical protein A2Y58_03275 [Chloroflexi bacterium RBG_13_51_52]|nr:MAG: hypothetical protein A2Y58_03275 [Chloroflexi bacterium RBG_13_51_52]
MAFSSGESYSLATSVKWIRRKAFLRSFVKKIVVEKEKVKLYYNLPMPPDGRKMYKVGFLPIDTPSGDGVTIGRSFELEFSLKI